MVGGEEGAPRLRVGHEVLSITAGRRSPGDNETWWRNDNVQEVIKAKKEAMKIWEHQEGRKAEIATGMQTRWQRKLYHVQGTGI